MTAAQDALARFELRAPPPALDDLADRASVGNN